MTDYYSLVKMDVDSQVVTSTTINPHQLRQQSNLWVVVKRNLLLVICVFTSKAEAACGSNAPANLTF